MKKIYILLIPIFILILTGCGNNKTLVCTRDNETTNNVLIRSTVNVEYTDEKLVNFKLETITDLSKTDLLNDEFVESIIKSSSETTKKLSNIEGIDTKYEKVDVGVKYTLEVDYDELKEEDTKDLDQTLYKKDMKIEDLKEGYLKDWTCED